MARSDRIIATISRIHAAGLAPSKWPEALSLVADLIGGNGASLEFLARHSLQPHAMHTHGLPDVSDYVEHYAPMCPRLPFAARQPAGTICYDALCTDEAEMDTNPFYVELLAPLDMRYFVGAVIATSPKELVLSGIQLSARQGHPDAAKIKTMALFVPHIQQATDVMRRLGSLANLQHSFEDTLDWLADGVLKLAADGNVRYANLAAQEILRRKDGIAIRRGAVQFLSARANAKFNTALSAVARLRGADADGATSADFIAETCARARRRSRSRSVRSWLRTT